MKCKHDQGVVAGDGGDYFCFACREVISYKDLGLGKKCPVCKRIKTAPANIGWIREFGMCLSCDHTEGEKHEQQHTSK